MISIICSGVDDTPLLEGIMVDGATLKPRWVRLLIVSVYNNYTLQIGQNVSLKLEIM